MILDNCHECTKCGQLFTNEEALKKHTKAKHPDRSVLKRYKCDICSYSSDQKGNFEQHKRVHLKERPFECLVCSKKFSTKSNLQRHNLIHTKERPYECNKCGKKFNDSSNLKTHKRTVHEGDKPFVCKVCGHTSGLLAHLKKHMLTHIARTFKCQYCDMRFGHAGYLRRHERIHTGEKPFKRDKCSKTFTQSTSLHGDIIAHHSKSYPY